MSESIKSRPVLSTGQVTFLFVMFISMLIAIFAAGIYIGRSSQPTVDKKGISAQAMNRANISFIESEATIRETPKPEPQTTTQPALQTTQENSLYAPIEESKGVSEYAIQVETKSSADVAEGLVTQLRRDGFTKSYVRAPQSGSVNQLFSVEIGPYDDKSSAEQLTTQLKNKGLNHCRVIQTEGSKKVTRPEKSNAQLSPATP